FVFLQTRGVPRDVHSFPTRRSSDLGSAGGSPTRYAVFDLLEQDGRSLMSRPLSQRRAALVTLIGRRTAPLFISRRLIRDGKAARSEEHTSELQSLAYLVCRLLLEKK